MLFLWVIPHKEPFSQVLCQKKIMFMVHLVTRLTPMLGAYVWGSGGCHCSHSRSPFNCIFWICKWLHLLLIVASLYSWTWVKYQSFTWQLDLIFYSYLLSKLSSLGDDSKVSMATAMHTWSADIVISRTWSKNLIFNLLSYLGCWSSMELL